MTYQTFEESSFAGEPVELYTVTLGTRIFRWTSAEDEITVGGLTYTPVAITSSEIFLGPEAPRNVVTLVVPSNLEFVQNYVGVQPDKVATVQIDRFHRSDGPTPEIRRLFSGFVAGVSFTQNGFLAEVSVKHESALLNKDIPLYTFQRLCNHVVYDARCKVIQGPHTYTGQVSSLSADLKTITVDGLDGFGGGPPFATAGFIRIPTTSEQRMIIEHKAVNQIVLQVPFRGLLPGATVNVLRGCNHSIQVCKQDFDNVINYGGDAFAPTKDVFKSGLL